MSRLLLASLLLALPAAGAAQAHPLVGRWAVELPGGMRVGPEGPTPLMTKGTLTVSVEGDSLVGQLKTEPIEGQPERPARRMAAKLAEGAVTFRVTSEARLSMNGEESVRTAVSVYRFEVKGDALSGTVERSIEGVEVQMGGAQPITGTRVKG